MRAMLAYREHSFAPEPTVRIHHWDVPVSRRCLPLFDSREAIPVDEDYREHGPAEMAMEDGFVVGCRTKEYREEFGYITRGNAARGLFCKIHQWAVVPRGPNGGPSESKSWWPPVKPPSWSMQAGRATWWRCSRRCRSNGRGKAPQNQPPVMDARMIPKSIAQAMTGIQWTDFTGDPWTGCNRIIANSGARSGCDICYAAPFGQARIPSFHARMRRLDGLAEATGCPISVFSLSLGDWLDPEVDPSLRAAMVGTVDACSHLTWLLLTHRPHLAHKLAPAAWLHGLPVLCCVRAASCIWMISRSRLATMTRRFGIVIIIEKPPCRSLCRSRNT